MTADARTLADRSNRAARALFDSRYGLMVPKTATGSSNPSFSDIEWGNGFTEVGVFSMFSVFNI